MSEHVLDASAMLALMLGERGSEKIIAFLPGAMIGAVNLAEVVGKLQERGVPDAEIDRDVASLDVPVAAFDETQAMVAGKLRARTKALGLSLGDRACLALAMARELPAVTMDRGWAALDIAVKVIIARE